MSSEKEILALEDKRREAEIGGQARSLNLLFLNAWAKTPQGWKFAAWQSCPRPG